MYTAESIEEFSQPQKFINLNNPAERELLQTECSKLKYLRTYPTVVRANIREKSAEIRSLETELSLDIHSKTSQILQIKRRQDLEPSYTYLKKLRAELLTIKEELVYAERIKLLAGVKLEMYNTLLEEYEQGGAAFGDSRNKK